MPQAASFGLAFGMTGLGLLANILQEIAAL
jgi:hypothetical protein